MYDKIHYKLKKKKMKKKKKTIRSGYPLLVLLGDSKTWVVPSLRNTQADVGAESFNKHRATYENGYEGCPGWISPGPCFLDAYCVAGKIIHGT